MASHTSRLHRVLIIFFQFGSNESINMSRNPILYKPEIRVLRIPVRSTEFASGTKNTTIPKKKEAGESKYVVGRIGTNVITTQHVFHALSPCTLALRKTQRRNHACHVPASSLVLLVKISTFEFSFSRSTRITIVLTPHSGATSAIPGSLP